MAGNPTFLGDGHDPRRSDALWAIEQKILGAIMDSSSVVVGGGASLIGVGSPEGAVTATPGTLYTDSSINSLWVKETGVGNTGWTQLIA